MDVARLRLLLGLAFQVRKHIEILHGIVHIGNDNLAGYCCIGARHLLVLATKNKLAVDFWCGRYRISKKQKLIGHCWLEADNYIIDVTATQFGIEKQVYLTHKSNPCYLRFATGEAAIDNTNHWKEDQRYNQYVPILAEITALVGLELILEDKLL